MVARHTGCPVRADNNVTCSGNVPRIGVVSISAWMRTDPEASTRRVNLSNESELSPTDPKTATYDASGTVNSNEWRAPSYMYGVKEVTGSCVQALLPPIGNICCVRDDTSRAEVEVGSTKADAKRTRVNARR